jgi:hypothetical protein
MAYAGGAAAAASISSSSYRVKFNREEFLELYRIAKPNIVYQTGRMHFFSYDGFVMYSFECRDEDFRKVLRAIEFSNYQWNE